MQTLFVKTPGGGTKQIHVLRSWMDAGGLEIFHHANGAYGYKNGDPVRKATEFDIITDPGQRALALGWWKRIGEAQSKAFYEAITERLREDAGDFRPDLAPDGADLDGILYARRPTGKKKGAVSAPHAWMEWFGRRPDWWGQAKRVEFLDYAYEMIESEETTEHTVGAPGTQDETSIDDTLRDFPREGPAGRRYETAYETVRQEGV